MACGKETHPLSKRYHKYTTEGGIKKVFKKISNRY
nr:MAG TPA: hypothetical protein [Caudoviricetes sp.]